MDSSMMDQMTDREKAQVLSVMSEMQVEESMNTYNNLVERCFNECVTTFRSKGLEQNEINCTQRCVQKFMAFSQRVAQRFQEKQKAGM